MYTELFVEANTCEDIYGGNGVEMFGGSLADSLFLIQID